MTVGALLAVALAPLAVLFAVALVQLAVLFAYVPRIAAVSERTIGAGPFVSRPGMSEPPDEG